MHKLFTILYKEFANAIPGKNNHLRMDFFYWRKTKVNGLKPYLQMDIFNPLKKQTRSVERVLIMHHPSSVS